MTSEGTFGGPLLGGRISRCIHSLFYFYFYWIVSSWYIPYITMSLASCLVAAAEGTAGTRPVTRVPTNEVRAYFGIFISRVRAFRNGPTRGRNSVVCTTYRWEYWCDLLWVFRYFCPFFSQLEAAKAIGPKEFSGFALHLYEKTNDVPACGFKIVIITRVQEKLPPEEFWVEVTSTEDASVIGIHYIKAQRSVDCNLSRQFIYPGWWEKASAELVASVSARRKALSLTMLSTVMD
jgi:hypothetical protein